MAVSFEDEEEGEVMSDVIKSEYISVSSFLATISDSVFTNVFICDNCR